VRVVENGVDLVRFSPIAADKSQARQHLGLPQTGMVLAYIGRLSEEKRPLEFVQIVAKVARRHPEAKALMVGDGPMLGAVEKAVAEARLQERVTLAGAFEHERIPLALAAADMLVVPSQIEGAPLIVLEAMAMEKAVVATDVGNIMTLLGEDAPRCTA